MYILYTITCASTGAQFLPSTVLINECKLQLIHISSYCDSQLLQKNSLELFSLLSLQGLFCFPRSQFGAWSKSDSDFGVGGVFSARLWMFYAIYWGFTKASLAPWRFFVRPHSFLPFVRWLKIHKKHHCPQYQKSEDEWTWHIISCVSFKSFPLMIPGSKKILYVPETAEKKTTELSSPPPVSPFLSSKTLCLATWWILVSFTMALLSKFGPQTHKSFLYLSSKTT